MEKELADKVVVEFADPAGDKVADFFTLGALEKGCEIAGSAYYLHVVVGIL